MGIHIERRQNIFARLSDSCSLEHILYNAAFLFMFIQHHAVLCDVCGSFLGRAPPVVPSLMDKNPCREKQVPGPYIKIGTREQYQYTLRRNPCCHGYMLNAMCTVMHKHTLIETMGRNYQTSQCQYGFYLNQCQLRNGQHRLHMTDKSVPSWKSLYY